MRTVASNPFQAAMLTDRTLAIFGAGGHGREVAWLASQCGWDWGLLRFLVDQPEWLVPPIDEIPVMLLGEETKARELYVAGVGDPRLRERVSRSCEETGYVPAILVHPRVEASSRVSIGAGTIICAGSIITTGVRIGRHVHVNLDCTISHDVDIGDFSTISPGVHISGHVQIGSRVFIGTGAVIINGSASEPLVVGDNAVIAAAACVTRPVDTGALVAGVPAVRKR